MKTEAYMSSHPRRNHSGAESKNSRDAFLASYPESFRAFINPDDLVQIRYEAVRAVLCENRTRKDVAKEWGFSRPTLNRLISSFQKMGLSSLAERRSGPTEGFKVTDKLLDRVVVLLEKEGRLSPSQVQEELRQAGTTVHLRTAERTLMKAWESIKRSRYKRM